MSAEMLLSLLQVCFAIIISLLAGHYYTVVRSIGDNKKDCEARDKILTTEVSKLKDQVNAAALASANAATVAAQAALTASSMQFKREQFDAAARKPA